MPAIAAVPLIDESVELAQRELHASEVPWNTIVWNDPVNLMSYVAWVFRRHFGMDALTAQERMMQVHTEGRAVVAEGNREAMERHVEAMHEYGLWATVQRVPR
jgi:ATP-dependent Clp protease adaptor protein ClpS